ncbi:MAG: hypothetical protein IJB57_10465 [Clostridia bacterium]|nr:hypothetical protein [Clostridia bacterium]
MKKFLALLLAAVMLLSFAACTPATKDPSTGDEQANAEPTSMAVCLASEPDTIDPALNSAVDGATMVSIFSPASLSGHRTRMASSLS